MVELKKEREGMEERNDKVLSVRQGGKTFRVQLKVLPEITRSRKQRASEAPPRLSLHAVQLEWPPKALHSFQSQSRLQT